MPKEVPPIPVDLTDPEDIRAKLPEVERMVKAKHDEWAAWDSLATLLARTVGIKREATKLARGSTQKPKSYRKKKRSTQDIVVAILAEVGKSLTVAEVTARTDPPAKRETVGWALWQAAKDEQIQRVRQGVYAPLGYEPSQAELQASRNGSGEADKK